MGLAVVVAAVVFVGACASSSEEVSSGSTTETVLIEPASEVGPAAFTPPVDTAPAGDAPTGSCSPEALITELEARPDAHREWAEVLSVPEDQVAAYINTLEPRILSADTRVTNHGLGDDGQAFPRQATLTSETAVLVDTSSGEDVLVTRCKCGNPLLPPVDTAATTTTYYDTTTTYYDTTTTYYDTTTTYYDTSSSFPPGREDPPAEDPAGEEDTSGQ